MEQVIMEIRPGEGGKDSKLFMYDMLKMYSSYCVKKGYTLECL
jgi:protein subunit release factor A